MSERVKVKYDDLDGLKTELHNVIAEFDAAGSRRDDLSDAVGRPYGEDALQSAADDFEGRWDDKRKTLMDNCKKVAEHLDGVIKGFKDFDLKASQKSGNNGGK